MAVRRVFIPRFVCVWCFIGFRRLLREKQKNKIVAVFFFCIGKSVLAVVFWAKEFIELFYSFNLNPKPLETPLALSQITNPIIINRYGFLVFLFWNRML